MIVGRVVKDLNGDGVKQANEPFLMAPGNNCFGEELPGLAISWSGPEQGSVSPATCVSGDAAYSSGLVQSGSYQVSLALPAGWTLVHATATITDSTNGPDPWFYVKPPASYSTLLEGRVVYDKNSNRQADSGDSYLSTQSTSCSDVAVSGLAVRWTGPVNGRTRVRDCIDQRPAYVVRQLPPGTYRVTLAIPSPWSATADLERVTTQPGGPDPWFYVRQPVDACVPPTIDAQPFTIIATPGTTVTLSVGASGTGPLSYQWYGGNPGMTGLLVDGATTSNLPVTVTGGTRTFWVRVSNVCGAVNSSAARAEPPAAPEDPPIKCEFGSGQKCLIGLVEMLATSKMKAAVGDLFDLEAILQAICTVAFHVSEGRFRTAAVQLFAIVEGMMPEKLLIAHLDPSRVLGLGEVVSFVKTAVQCAKTLWNLATGSSLQGADRMTLAGVEGSDVEVLRGYWQQAEARAESVLAMLVNTSAPIDIVDASGRHILRDPDHLDGVIPRSLLVTLNPSLTLIVVHNPSAGLRLIAGAAAAASDRPMPSGSMPLGLTFFAPSGAVHEFIEYNATLPPQSTATLIVSSGAEAKQLSIDSTGDGQTDLQIPPTGVTASADSDGDGLPDAWEARFGLLASSAEGDEGASGDADGDGISNRDELLQGSHPRGFFHRYLAEGADSAFFRTRISLLNTADDAPATAQLIALKEDGTLVRQTLTVPSRTRRTLELSGVSGLEFATFSVTVESDRRLVVDRTMTWGDSGYGSHAETAVEKPSLIWYLAEGATFGRFSLFYLLENPDATREALVRIRYLRGVGEPMVKEYTIAPSTRRTIGVDGIPGLEAVDVSGVVEALNDVPIVVERAMYLDRPGQPFAGGHSSTGVTAPSTHWFLAEGATGFFDMFVLVANPGGTDANIEATYLLPSGQTVKRQHVVRANSRSTFNVAAEHPLLKATPVSTAIESLNGVPIVVERAMWWPSGDWQEGHDSLGSTETGIQWALADGEEGGPRKTRTYILVANTSAYAGTVKVSILFEDGTSEVREFPVAGSSRFSVGVAADFPRAVGRRFAAIVESIGDPAAQIVVERAMYSDADGVMWAAGTDALATRLK